MKGFYLFLAHLVVAVHFLWILFLLLGWLFAFKGRIVRSIHLSGLLFALFLNLTHLHCPLTYLEIWLRKKAGAEAYDSSFIIHYLEKLIYIRIDPELLRLLTYIFVSFFILFHSSYFYSHLFNYRNRF
ncbi:MAG: DUF2784 domain-containing protein, partial [Aquificaceae bacterium]|nr:DUF2784 domain-containing protein [Aquificaceae bacterium]